MIHSKRNRRTRQSAHNVAISAIAELVEPRMLLSATSVLPNAKVSDFSAAAAQVQGTKQVTVEAAYYANTGGHSLKIDEIRLVGDEIRVFSSITKPAPGTIVTFAFEWHRDTRTVTVPNRELTVTYHYANVDSPKTDLYALRQAGTSSLLYRNPLADTSTAWPIADPATKEISIEATVQTGFAYSLRIDEIRLVGDEIVVFSTLTPPPPGIYPAIAMTVSETRTLTVPNRELSVTYRYANLNSLQTELYHLRQSGTSSLLYRSPLADPLKPWTIVDVDAGPGSDVGLDFTAKPPAPEGLMARSLSGNMSSKSDGLGSERFFFGLWFAVNPLT